MTRAFIALDLNPSVIANIGLATDELRRHLPDLRWVTPANFHLTLKFLGGIDDAAVPAIGAALRREIGLFPRFTINAKGLGVFPSPGRPRVLWVGFTGDSLALLASKIESALEPLGFAPESRRFTPHMTIGRWRESASASRPLREQLAKWANHEFGTSAVESVNVMQSLLHPKGASYRNLLAVALARSSAH